MQESVPGFADLMVHSLRSVWLHLLLGMVLLVGDCQAEMSCPPALNTLWSSCIFGNQNLNEACPKWNLLPCSLSCLWDLGRVLSWSQTTLTHSPHHKCAVTGSEVWWFLWHGKAPGQPPENTAPPSCGFMAWKLK